MKLKATTMLVLGLGSLGGCGMASEHEPGPSEPASAVPQAASGDFYATSSILARSAALVEGVVKKIEETYDEHSGPRTIVTLEVTNVHAGKLAQRQIQLRMFGGTAPNGKRIWTSLSVDFAVGGRYVLFLRNDAWFYSPLATEALEVKTIRGRQVLLAHGQPLVGLRPDGMRFGRELETVSFASDDVKAKVLEPSPDSLLGTLDTSEFVALVHEAIAVEGVAPSRSYTAQPEQRSYGWRVVPTSPEPEPRAAPSPAKAAPDETIPVEETPHSETDAPPTVVR